jgi:outer membrane cobalamin receptor
VNQKLRENRFMSIFSLECVYFENNFRNLIQWYFNDAGFIQPDNVGRSYIKGTEFIWNSVVEEITGDQMMNA